MGTEYQVGDLGKMFLQFLDANNNAVSNSECFLSIWYPNDTIITGFNNTLMSKLNNASEGIYYKNINIPNVTGVYPASAKCYLPLTFNNILNNSFAYEGFETGNWTGGTGGWATCPAGSGANCTNGWDVEDTVPLSTIVTNATAGCFRGNYCAKFTGSYGFIERGLQFPDGTSQVNISYAFKFKGFQNNEYFQFYIFDGNWHVIQSIGKLAQYGGYTNEVWYWVNLSLSESQFEFGNILIGWYTTNQMPSTSDEVWIDAVNITTLSANISISNLTAFQVLRGSGEIHVSNFIEQLTTQLQNLTVNTNLSSILEQLSTNSNLSTEQYQNLTQQINSLQNNITLQYNNITQQLNQVLDTTQNITTQITTIQNFATTINQTITTTLTQIQLLNQTLYTQFNITDDLIQNTLTTLTNQITNINTSITNQITTSTQQVINTLLSMNTTLTNQITALNTTLSAQLTQLQDQIYSQTNLTNQQYMNLTNQINNLQNNIASCCINLSADLNNLNFTLSQLQNTANTLLAGQNQMNTTVTQIYNDLQLLNQTITSQFSITNQLITDSYNNITLQMNQINLTMYNQYQLLNQTLTNLENITTTNQNWLTIIWAYLAGYLNTTITNINLNILQINQTLNNLSQTTPTNLTGVPVTIIANTTNCITTSNWQIQALVLNQYNQPMTDTQTTCNITTTLWNETTMTYTTPYFTYQNTCPTPMDWNWTIQCV
jgi:uncharacterized coiled-coil DUF342 family protein